VEGLILLLAVIPEEVLQEDHTEEVHGERETEVEVQNEGTVVLAGIAKNLNRHVLLVIAAAATSVDGLVLTKKT